MCYRQIRLQQNMPRLNSLWFWLKQIILFQYYLTMTSVVSDVKYVFKKRNDFSYFGCPRLLYCQEVNIRKLFTSWCCLTFNQWYKNFKFYALYRRVQNNATPVSLASCLSWYTVLSGFAALVGQTEPLGVPVLLAITEADKCWRDGVV